MGLVAIMEAEVVIVLDMEVEVVTIIPAQRVTHT